MWVRPDKLFGKEKDCIPLQDYLHALDVISHESPTDRCVPIGISLHPHITWKE